MIQNDLQAREQALDPGLSFIVQAPAGSGKTELLTQRFLRLLSLVREPEEIIAITFTRKAAAEMRQRVLQDLALADQAAPTAAHKQTTWQLACQARKQDQRHQWHLQQNPNRLRIMTIDALAAWLGRQLPILSQLGAPPELTENAEPLYQEAANALLAELCNEPHWQSTVEHILEHLDYRYSQFIDLCCQILARRDQWLPHVLNVRDQHNLRDSLEEGLQRVIIENLTITRDIFNPNQAQRLMYLAGSAADYLAKEESNSPITSLANSTHLPSAELTSLTLWQGISTLLLTQDGEWRKSIDKRVGFPPSSEAKGQMLELINELNKIPSLLHALRNIQGLPPATYTHQQWLTLEHLLTLLPLLAAQLQLIFKKYGVIDFIEMNLAAQQALTDHEQPTDLALYLDYQIKHLLIDEFQDTSVTQFNLLNQLISGWDNHDGRTLFCVGDPMQSIYRFRQAEVGLFLRAQQQGFGSLQLIPLTLKQNFRSSTNLVDWYNNCFSNILPSTADIALGAVPYSATIATRLETHGSTQWHALLDTDTTGEAEYVSALIQKIQADHSSDSIAILVRSRAHLYELLPKLRSAGITFQAVEIEPLFERSVVQDLYALSSAYLHRADRIAWLALLRAPWCGLNLKDLHEISQHNTEQSLWASINDDMLLTRLSIDGQQRLQHTRGCIAHAFAQQGRNNLADSIKGLWLALGGPACYTELHTLEDAQAFFDLVTNLEQNESYIDTHVLHEALQRLYAKSAGSAQCTLQIMTIHKAKGLEFDHVILPSLNRKLSADSKQLLLWQERPNLVGSSDLILAPIHAAEDPEDSLYDYLRNVEKQKLEYEAARLLYVATTRAKQSLHLVATLEYDSKRPNQLANPMSGSFWAMLYPRFQAEGAQVIHWSTVASIASDRLTTVPQPRLSSEWIMPDEIALRSNELPDVYQTKPYKFSFSLDRDYAQLIGTVIHESLEYLSIRDPRDDWQGWWTMRLQQIGMTPNSLSDALDAIQLAIDNTLADPRGRWILTAHQDAKSEYALTHIKNDNADRLVIDRCFIDKDIRWIIDYKTAAPTADQTLEDFLEKQKSHYIIQLERYAEVFKELENKPIKLGLYFPSCRGWIEWDYT